MLTIPSALSFLKKEGACLVYPVQNRPDPPSLWRHFHPRKKMAWEWDSSADSGVSELWIFRERLARSGKCVYLKWAGRATFLSSELFVAARAHMNAGLKPLSREALGLLDQLDERSPLSTKQLKKAARLEGRFQESAYVKALKELWDRLLIVGWGEVDDGAFPSLAVGAAHHLFEGLCAEAATLSPTEAEARLQALVPENSWFLKSVERTRSRLRL